MKYNPTDPKFDFNPLIGLIGTVRSNKLLEFENSHGNKFGD